MTIRSYKTFTLITGASGGIGYELAKICAAEGRNLILVARSGDKLRDLVATLDPDITVHTIVQDLSEPQAAQKIYKKVGRLRLHVDQLINNAGMGDFGPFAKTKLERQEQLIALNITALVALTRLIVPHMLRLKHGRILNLSSISGFAPSPELSVYAASKSFVLSFSEALSEELRGSGVTVTCLALGPTKTGFAHAGRAWANHPAARAKTSAHSVAAYGYQALKTGRVIAIPGLASQLFCNFLVRFLPRAAVRRMMARVGH